MDLKPRPVHRLPLQSQHLCMGRGEVLRLIWGVTEFDNPRFRCRYPDCPEYQLFVSHVTPDGRIAAGAQPARPPRGPWHDTRLRGRRLAGLARVGDGRAGYRPGSPPEGRLLAVLCTQHRSTVSGNTSPSAPPEPQRAPTDRHHRRGHASVSQVSQYLGPCFVWHPRTGGLSRVTRIVG